MDGGRRRQARSPSSLREIASGNPSLRLARALLLGLGFPGARGAMAALGVLCVLDLSPIPEEFRAPVDASPAPLASSRHPHPPLPPCLVRGAGSSAQHPALPIVTKARCFLHRYVRVDVQDGRVFVGKLHCLDKQKNLILYDTVEFRSFPDRAAVGVEATPAAEKRSLGLVLIPAQCRTSCYVKCSFDEKMEFLNIRS